MPRSSIGRFLSTNQNTKKAVHRSGEFLNGESDVILAITLEKKREGKKGKKEGKQKRKKKKRTNNKDLRAT